MQLLKVTNWSSIISMHSEQDSVSLNRVLLARSSLGHECLSTRHVMDCLRSAQDAHHRNVVFLSELLSEHAGIVLDFSAAYLVRV